MSKTLIKRKSFLLVRNLIDSFSQSHYYAVGEIYAQEFAQNRFLIVDLSCIYIMFSPEDKKVALYE